MRPAIFIFFLFCCSIAVQAQPVFDALVKQSDHVVRAEVVERGRCVRMEDGVTYCTYRCVVKEVFKGKLIVNDTILVEVTEYGMVPLGGKLTDDTTRICEPGREYVFFLRSSGKDGVMNEELYVPADVVLGIQRVTEHLLWELRD